MKKIASLVLLIAFCMSLVGCYTHVYDTGSGAPSGKEVYKEWHHHFLFGIIGEKKIDIKDVCPSGNATIKDEASFVNGLVGFLCLGGLVYYPTTVKITCEGGKTSSIELNEQEMAAIVADPAFVEGIADHYPELLSEAQAASVAATAIME